MTEPRQSLYRDVVSRLAIFLLLSASAWGQTLEIAPAAVDRGSSNIFRILFKSAAGHPVSALQWELAFPDSLRIEARGVVTTDDSDASGKSVACAARPDRDAQHILACIIAGGRSTLPAGAIVIVRFSAPSDAPIGPATVALENIVGVSNTLERVSMARATGLITIR